MKQKIIYRYLGTNGIIESEVHLEDIYYVRLNRLIADEGKTLTNGTQSSKIITIPEEEAENWEEVPEGQE